MTKSGTDMCVAFQWSRSFSRPCTPSRPFQQAIGGLQRQGGALSGRCVPCAQSVNLTFTGAPFCFWCRWFYSWLPGTLASGDFAGLVTNFAF